MSLTSPDAISLYTPYPALQVFQTNAFTVSISGALAASASSSWSGSTTLTQAGGLVRPYVNQTPVPADAFTPYTSADWLPVSPYGTTGTIPSINIGCSVAGNPSVTSIACALTFSESNTNLSALVQITNPYGGVMTLTSTTLTIRYIVYVVTPAFTN